MPVLHFIAIRWMLYVLEILVACGPFFGRQPRRKCFYVSLVVGLVLLGAAITGMAFLQAWWLEQAHYDPVVSTVASIIGYLLFPTLVFLVEYAIFDSSIGTTLSCLVQSCAVRSLAFAIYILFIQLIGQDYNFLVITGLTNVGNLFIYLGFFAFSYGGFFFLTRRSLSRRSPHLSNTVLWIYLGVLVTMLTIHAIGEYYNEDNKTLYIVFVLSEITTYLVLFLSDYLIRRNDELQAENQVVTQLMQEQARQFKFSKANAEDLRVKAHDLKHQVRVLREGGPEAEKLLSSLETDIDEFESTIYLDNEVLNIVLREKWGYCKKHRIRLSYTGDPNAFQSVPPVDLFALSGNVLDNAIEATMKLSDKSKRVISASIYHRNGMSTFRCDNFYEGELSIKQGRIQTSKTDTFSHGFGIRSIERIAKRYGGVVDIKAEKGIFVLKVSIPDEE